MASRANVPATVSSSQYAANSSGKSAAILIAGWLVPGAGHLLLRHWFRAALLFVSVVAMFSIGIALQGKVYAPNTGDPLDMLGFAGDLGTGLLYILARAFDWGHSTVQIAIADYGTKFIVVAGLLNIISAADAYALSTGRKPR
ncbi:MAG: DUF6677 family protein [Acidobacteriaceae bacterium]